MPLEVMHIGKKQYPRMFLGTILLKGCHQEMLKYLFPALVFNLILNIAFDEVLNFALLENTVQLQEVVIRQKSIH
jgi:hypothetical protein